MATVSMKALLEAGVHFGHQTRRWNPKMSKYIFGARNNIHIIDLQKTVKELKKALTYVRDLAASGKVLLFVGTKKQAREAIAQEAARCGMPYIRDRWLGGTLTNFATVRKSVLRLEELEAFEKDGSASRFTKRELLQKSREQEKLAKYLQGIRSMRELPGAVIVVDIKKEHIAVLESKRLGIPCIGLVDTNCNPHEVDYPIPANDDAIKSISLLVGTLADACLLGNEGRDPVRAAGRPAETEGKEEAE